MTVRDKSPTVLKHTQGAWIKNSSGVRRWVKREKWTPKDIHDPRGMPWCSCTPLLSQIILEKEE